MDFLKIDGSFGEGGGQIVRSAVTLSCITQRPIQLENIRKNRKKPGLRPQHLTAIRILGKICNAKINGLEVGSTTVKFVPADMENKVLDEDVGTAGSVSLVLAALIPAVSLCRKNLEIGIRGGTDVSWSPTSEYTKRVLSEAYSRIGIGFSMDVKKRGYYPRGGGVISAKISPCKDLKPIILDKRDVGYAEIFCSYSKISNERITSIVRQVASNLESNGFQTKCSISNEDAADEGSSILVMSKDSKSIIGMDGLYDGKAGGFSSRIDSEFISSNMSVDEHLSDMLVIPASLTDGMSVFKVNRISSHLETNLYVASKFTDCKYGTGKIDDGYEVRIVGDSDAGIK